MEYKLALFILLACVVDTMYVVGFPGALPPPSTSKKPKVDNMEMGLYNASDKVITVTGGNLRTTVYNRNYAVVIEFYNSYCGFCRRFAPVWKEFAADVHEWGEYVIVAALDCADDENNGACRDFEIMHYPCLRYFAPFSKDENNNIGNDLKHVSTVPELRNHIIEQFMNDTTIPENRPDLKMYPDATNIPALNAIEMEQLKFIFVISEPTNSTDAASVILDLARKVQQYAKIYRVATSSNSSTVAAIDIHKNVLNSNLVLNGTRDTIRAGIISFLNQHHISLPTAVPTAASPSVNQIFATSEKERSVENSSNFIESAYAVYSPSDLATLKRLKANDVIFHADIELAVQFTLFHEIPSHQRINGDRLQALQSYLNVIAKYFPFGPKGREFLRDLRDYVFAAHPDNEITGSDFVQMANMLKSKHHPIFSSTKWVGCYSANNGIRGFPCGLWTLFHYLTVQSAEIENKYDSLQILQAMHRYIKNFFGCSECSNHFQEMAKRRHIWDVDTKDDAILWLWEAHNEVNNRLAGDITEDSNFPKIQFPSHVTCAECRHSIQSTTSNGTPIIDWNKPRVLEYLKHIYSYEQLSRFGVEDESMLPVTLAAHQSARTFTNVVSDLDMRMGIVLYISCVVMMIVAVKIFLKRGYRKKMYVHDILGKV